MRNMMKIQCGHPENAFTNGECRICADKLTQCAECLLWFPQFDPKTEGEEGTIRTHCEECGHDKLRWNGNFYRCIGCGLAMVKRERSHCLDGPDVDGTMSHVSGKPAVRPICIFCDMPGIAGDKYREATDHATRGIDFNAPSETTLKQAAQAVVSAWASGGSLDDLTSHIESLEVVLGHNND